MAEALGGSHAHKTGTITRGEPALTDVAVTDERPKGELLRLSPMIAAAAMALSSLSVVTNANRLRGWGPPRFSR